MGAGIAREWHTERESGLFRSIIPYDIVIDSRLLSCGRLSFCQSGAASGHLALQNEL